MSAARSLQRAMERNDVNRMAMAEIGKAWSLCATFDALFPDDDTMGTDDVPAFLEAYELIAGEGL